MNYYIFLDESGDHGLVKIDPDFPIFALCGVIMSEKQYQGIRNSFNKIKSKYWNDKKVIFHSRDIRKCEKEFKILLDLKIKSDFYSRLDTSITDNDFTIISSVIDKESYIKKYGKLGADVYEIALSFIIERAIFYLDDLGQTISKLYLILEKRGKKEDAQLKRHFITLIQRGTYYVNPARMQQYNLSIEFRSKYQNVNGLQLADLIAYPIARYVMDRERANPAYDIIESKIYSKEDKKYGLKIFP